MDVQFIDHDANTGTYTLKVALPVEDIQTMMNMSRSQAVEIVGGVFIDKLIGSYKQRRLAQLGCTETTIRVGR